MYLYRPEKRFRFLFHAVYFQIGLNVIVDFGQTFSGFSTRFHVRWIMKIIINN